MVNKDRTFFFQYKCRDSVYIISPLTSQLHTASCKATIKYVGPAVIYKIIDPHSYIAHDFRWQDTKRTLWTREIKIC